MKQYTEAEVTAIAEDLVQFAHAALPEMSPADYVYMGFMDAQQRLLKQANVSGSAIDVVKWIDGCPVTVDEATVPKAGIDAAPQQVVVNLSLSYQWWLKVKEVAKHCR